MGAERALPITATVREMTKLSSLSERTIYNLMESGELESIKIGTRRLIIVESFLSLVKRLQSGGAIGGKRRGPKPKLLYLRDIIGE